MQLEEVEILLQLASAPFFIGQEGTDGPCMWTDRCYTLG